jgi:glucose/arabinose dehydrogenase
VRPARLRGWWGAILLVVVAACSSGTRTDADVAPPTTAASISSLSDESVVTGPTTGAPTTSLPPGPTIAADQVELALVQIAEVSSPVAFVQRPGSAELFVAEKAGRVRNLSTNTVVLDIAGEVSTGNEQGLLGMAFSPEGGQLFVNFTDRSRDTVVRRYDVDGSTVDAGSIVDVIRVDQLRSNHNGGHLVFGPDHYLYIGLGDGGGGGDPGENGQNPNTLLGSMLRIIPTDDGYDIPPDNPFAGGGDGAPEVFMWGLRNPWRYSFDPDNGDLWIGDVGQDRFEEVDVVRAAEGGGNGANLGWNELEGSEPYRGGSAPDGHTQPRVAYAQTDGRCSVTGGEVYRGAAIPSLVGTYVFGDFCTGEIFGVAASGDATMFELDIDHVSELSSFATDSAGELYAISLGGTIFRVDAA